MNYFAALTNVKDLDDEELVDVSTKVSKKSGRNREGEVVARNTVNAEANGRSTQENR